MESEEEGSDTSDISVDVEMPEHALQEIAKLREALAQYAGRGEGLKGNFFSLRNQSTRHGRLGCSSARTTSSWHYTTKE